MMKFTFTEKRMDATPAMKEYAEASYWLADGVHPTAMGHQIIADEWVKIFEEIR